MMEIVEKCREIEQASREAFNAMIDEKKQKGISIINNNMISIKYISLEISSYRKSFSTER